MNVLLALAASLLLAPEEPARSDLDKLQGTWVTVSMETEGHEVDPEAIKDRTSTYEGNRLTLRTGDTVYLRGIVTLNTDAKVKAMNTWNLSGSLEDQTHPGIYELDGDTMKLCFARPGEARPKAFTTKEGTGFVSIVMKRRKP